MHAALCSVEETLPGAVDVLRVQVVTGTGCVSEAMKSYTSRQEDCGRGMRGVLDMPVCEVLLGWVSLDGVRVHIPISCSTQV